jgi:hypothetical protein
VAPVLAVACVVMISAAAARPIANGERPTAIIDELLKAAAAEDLPRFDAGVERARTAIESMPLGNARNSFRRAIMIVEDVSRVWHFAITDAGGSYYDEERLPFYYDHLVADYPKYARFIAEFAINDHGLMFYPTRETRVFLLKELETIRGRSP